MAQIQVWIHDDKSIHDERFKGFNEVFTAAQFPRISDNITPRCKLFKSSHDEDDTYVFSKLTKIVPSKLNQVKLHNSTKDYLLKKWTKVK